MDRVMPMFFCGVAGAAFAFGPAAVHGAVLTPFAIASDRGSVTMGCAIAYAATATLPAALAAHDFSGSIPLAVLVWAVPTVIVGGAMGFALMSPARWRPIAAVLAVVAISIPPLAAVTLVSPVSVSGLLFPGLGVAGLAAFLALLAMYVALPTAVRYSALAVGCFMIAIASTVSPTHVDAATRMDGVDTWRGQTDAQTALLLQGVWRAEEQHETERSSAGVLIWPESVYGEWTPLTGAMLRFAQTEVVGGARHYVGPATYVNTLIDGRTGEIRYAQRQPLPFSVGAAHVAVAGPDRLEVPTRPLAALLCFELANPWLAYRTFSTADTEVIWAANLGWSERPGLATRMRATAEQWSRLYGVPVVSAINHPEHDDA